MTVETIGRVPTDMLDPIVCECLEACTFEISSQKMPQKTQTT